MKWTSSFFFYSYLPRCLYFLLSFDSYQIVANLLPISPSLSNAWFSYFCFPSFCYSSRLELWDSTSVAYYHLLPWPAAATTTIITTSFIPRMLSWVLETLYTLISLYISVTFNLIYCSSVKLVFLHLFSFPLNPRPVVTQAIYLLCFITIGVFYYFPHSI